MARAGHFSVESFAEELGARTDDGLRKLGELLVDVHGQRESHSLLEPSYQVQLLDAFGKLGDLRHAYDGHATRVRYLRRRRADLSAKQDARQRELSLIRFEREELDAVRLKANEQPQLMLERDRLTHAQALQEFTASATGRLYDDDGSVVEQLGRLFKEAQQWANIDPDSYRSFWSTELEVRIGSH